MNEEQGWALRGLTNQTWSVMQSLIAIIDDKRVTASRVKDLTRQLEYLVEQVKMLEPKA